MDSKHIVVGDEKSESAKIKKIKGELLAYSNKIGPGKFRQAEHQKARFIQTMVAVEVLESELDEKKKGRLLAAIAGGIGKPFDNVGIMGGSELKEILVRGAKSLGVTEPEPELYKAIQFKDESKTMEDKTVEQLKKNFHTELEELKKEDEKGEHTPEIFTDIITKALSNIETAPEATDKFEIKTKDDLGKKAKKNVKISNLLTRSTPSIIEQKKDAEIEEISSILATITRLEGEMKILKNKLTDNKELNSDITQLEELFINFKIICSTYQSDIFNKTNKSDPWVNETSLNESIQLFDKTIAGYLAVISARSDIKELPPTIKAPDFISTLINKLGAALVAFKSYFVASEPSQKTKNISQIKAQLSSVTIGVEKISFIKQYPLDHLDIKKFKMEIVSLRQRYPDLALCLESLDARISKNEENINSLLKEVKEEGEIKDENLSWNEIKKKFALEAEALKKIIKNKKAEFEWADNLIDTLKEHKEAINKLKVYVQPEQLERLRELEIKLGQINEAITTIASHDNLMEEDAAKALMEKNVEIFKHDLFQIKIGIDNEKAIIDQSIAIYQEIIEARRKISLYLLEDKIQKNENLFNASVRIDKSLKSIGEKVIRADMLTLQSVQDKLVNLQKELKIEQGNLAKFEEDCLAQQVLNRWNEQKIISILYDNKPEVADIQHFFQAYISIKDGIQTYKAFDRYDKKPELKSDKFKPLASRAVLEYLDKPDASLLASFLKIKTWSERKEELKKELKKAEKDITKAELKPKTKEFKHEAHFALRELFNAIKESMSDELTLDNLKTFDSRLRKFNKVLHGLKKEAETLDNIGLKGEFGNLLKEYDAKANAARAFQHYFFLNRSESQIVNNIKNFKAFQHYEAEIAKIRVVKKDENDPSRILRLFQSMDIDRLLELLDTENLLPIKGLEAKSKLTSMKLFKTQVNVVVTEKKLIEKYDANAFKHDVRYVLEAHYVLRELFKALTLSLSVDDLKGTALSKFQARRDNFNKVFDSIKINAKSLPHSLSSRFKDLIHEYENKLSQLQDLYLDVFKKLSGSSSEQDSNFSNFAAEKLICLPIEKVKQLLNELIRNNPPLQEHLLEQIIRRLIKNNDFESSELREMIKSLIEENKKITDLAKLVNLLSLIPEEKQPPSTLSVSSQQSVSSRLSSSPLSVSSPLTVSLSPSPSSPLSAAPFEVKEQDIFYENFIQLSEDEKKSFDSLQKCLKDIFSHLDAKTLSLSKDLSTGKNFKVIDRFHGEAGYLFDPLALSSSAREEARKKIEVDKTTFYAAMDMDTSVKCAMRLIEAQLSAKDAEQAKVWLSMLAQPTLIIIAKHLASADPLAHKWQELRELIEKRDKLISKKEVRAQVELGDQKDAKADMSTQGVLDALNNALTTYIKSTYFFFNGKIDPGKSKIIKTLCSDISPQLEIKQDPITKEPYLCGDLNPDCDIAKFINKVLESSLSVAQELTLKLSKELEPYLIKEPQREQLKLKPGIEQVLNQTKQDLDKTNSQILEVMTKTLCDKDRQAKIALLNNINLILDHEHQSANQLTSLFAQVNLTKEYTDPQQGLLLSLSYDDMFKYVNTALRLVCISKTENKQLIEAVILALQAKDKLKDVHSSSGVPQFKPAISKEEKKSEDKKSEEEKKPVKDQKAEKKSSASAIGLFAERQWNRFKSFLQEKRIYELKLECPPEEQEEFKYAISLMVSEVKVDQSEQAIRDRHEQVLQLLSDTQKLNQLFLEFQRIVQEQQSRIDQMAGNIESAHLHVVNGLHKLEEAEKLLGRGESFETALKIVAAKEAAGSLGNVVSKMLTAAVVAGTLKPG